jgi:hypothetical protein
MMKDKNIQERSVNDTGQAEDLPVAQILDQIRAGIRQRQAELAVIRKSREVRSKVEERKQRWEQLNKQISELQAKSLVQERPFVSSIPILGWLISFIRRVWNNVAARWYVLRILQQQNAFNQAAVQMIASSALTQIRLETRVDEMNDRMIAMRQYVDEIKRHGDEIKQYVDEVRQHFDRNLEQLETQFIGWDHDVSLLARKLAEKEYQVQQQYRRSAEERDELARRLGQIERMLADSPNEDTRE